MSTSVASQMQLAGQIAARLDRLPVRGEALSLVLLICLGSFFQIYNLWSTAYLTPGLARSGLFNTSAVGIFNINGVGFFVFMTFAGMFVGCMAFGFAADRFGRRTLFLASLLCYTICTAIMAFQNSAGWIDLLRFVSSVGVGMGHVTTDTFLSEVVPPRYRGRIYAVYPCIAFLSVPLAALISWQLVSITLLGLEGWRWVALVGSMAGFSAIWYWRYMPESPRWLVLHGQEEEAERVICAIEASVASKLSTPLPPVGVARPPEVGSSSFSELFRPPFGRRTMMLSVMNFFQSIIVFSFASWVPTLLIAQGIQVTTSLQYAFFIAIINPLGPLLVILIADRIERKWQIVTAATVSGLLALGFATATQAIYAVLFGMLITLSNNWLSTAVHNYQSELFPTRVRARGVGFVYAWSRVSSAFAGLLIGFFLHFGGVITVALFIAASVLILVINVSCFGPRTRQLPLEEISR